MVAKIKPAMFHDTEKLARLWDALAWLAQTTFDIDDIEGKFQISVHERKVMPRAVHPERKFPKFKRGVRA